MMLWGDPESGCRWVRQRLPLLVGDELTGSERRKAERHLIACLDCQRQRATLTRSLEVLQAASAVLPASSSEVSLWPAVERQIRESRHVSSRPVFSALDLVDWLEVHLFRRPSPMGLTLALAGLILTAGCFWSYLQTRSANAEMLAAGRPLEHAFVPRPAPVPGPELGSSSNMVQSDSPPPSRVDYDLDHGTPMPTETRGTKSTH